MAFTVIWMRGPQAMGTKRFEDLALATGYAVDNLGQVRSHFGATAVKVIDDAGAPHFLKAISRNT
ncbi:MAG: hypothetical protein JWO81_1415 [Alphaproteobacteria bacterium]|nr:hypothetical protein [Alphaproteobacteria bacterium]